MDGVQLTASGPVCRENVAPAAVGTHPGTNAPQVAPSPLHTLPNFARTHFASAVTNMLVSNGDGAAGWMWIVSAFAPVTLTATSTAVPATSTCTQSMPAWIEPASSGAENCTSSASVDRMKCVASGK